MKMKIQTSSSLSQRTLKGAISLPFSLFEFLASQRLKDGDEDDDEDDDEDEDDDNLTFFTLSKSKGGFNAATEMMCSLSTGTSSASSV